MGRLLKKKKELIVDDDSLNRSVVSGIYHMCRTGCAVRTARNGLEEAEAHRDSALEERRMKWIPIIF